MQNGAKEIVLGDGLGEIAVKANGALIEIHADGSLDVHAEGNIAAYTKADVDAYTDGAIHVHPAASDSKPAQAADPKPGDRMPDGTIFAGISPDTGKPMYTTPADAPLTMKWKAAMNYAAKLDAHGHKDWRVPTLGELKLLFNNRAAIGGFNVTGSHPAGWYWSSTDGNYGGARGRRFSDGYPYWSFKEGDSSLRCVR